MSDNVELEVCANCKREIPQYNYIMHTAHCARNISLCDICKEPIPKSELAEHGKTCVRRQPKIKPVVTPTKFEQSSYFAARKEVEDKKAQKRQEARLERMEKITRIGQTVGRTEPSRPKDLLRCQYCAIELPKFDLGEHEKYCGTRTEKCQDAEHSKMSVRRQPKIKPVVTPTKFEQSSYFVARKEVEDKKVQKRQEARLERLEKTTRVGHTEPPQPKDLLPCQYCEIELPKFDLAEHVTYCGARTEKCQDCNEIVMFKYRQLHLDSNHSYVGPHPPQRSAPAASDLPDYTYDPSERSLLSTTNGTGKKLETSKKISRQLDYKTEYIHNLLQESDSVTAPIRSTGAVPRHRQTEEPPLCQNHSDVLVIPCEFCDKPIPHDDLIQHQTGCQPDLTRCNQLREFDDIDFLLSPGPAASDVELPCEFCSDLIPASQLLSHQAACN